MAVEPRGGEKVSGKTVTRDDLDHAVKVGEQYRHAGFGNKYTIVRARNGLFKIQPDVGKLSAELSGCYTSIDEAKYGIDHYRDS